MSESDKRPVVGTITFGPRSLQSITRKLLEGTPHLVAKEPRPGPELLLVDVQPRRAITEPGHGWCIAFPSNEARQAWLEAGTRETDELRAEVNRLAEALREIAAKAHVMSRGICPTAHCPACFQSARPEPKR